MEYYIQEIVLCEVGYIKCRWKITDVSCEEKLFNLPIICVLAWISCFDEYLLGTKYNSKYNDRFTPIYITLYAH